MHVDKLQLFLKALAHRLRDGVERVGVSRLVAIGTPGLRAAAGLDHLLQVDYTPEGLERVALTSVAEEDGEEGCGRGSSPLRSPPEAGRRTCGKNASRSPAMDWTRLNAGVILFRLGSLEGCVH